MGFLSSLPVLGGLIESISGKFAANKDKIVEGQNRINEAEVAGAPASRLRLWRPFLGWVLTFVFAWEVVGRSIIITYWPDTVLPPSTLKEISHVLLGMLGLGF